MNYFRVFRLLEKALRFLLDGMVGAEGCGVVGKVPGRFGSDGHVLLLPWAATSPGRAAAAGYLLLVFLGLAEISKHHDLLEAGGGIRRERRKNEN